MNTSLCYICLVLQSAGWNICFSNPKYCTLFDIFSWRLWFQWTAKPLTVSLTSVMHVAMAPHGWQPVPASLTTSFCFFTVIFFMFFATPVSLWRSVIYLLLLYRLLHKYIEWVIHKKKSIAPGSILSVERLEIYAEVRRRRRWCRAGSKHQ